MGFYGDSSTYKELPLPGEIYDYEKYKTPFWTLDNDIEEKEDKCVEQTSKFIL